MGGQDRTVSSACDVVFGPWDGLDGEDDDFDRIEYECILPGCENVPCWIPDRWYVPDRSFRVEPPFAANRSHFSGSMRSVVLARV